MKIDRLKIANGFKSAKFSDEIATEVANILGDAIEDSVSDMASLKDLQVIVANANANAQEQSNKTIMWMLGIAFAIIGVIISLKLFG